MSKKNIKKSHASFDAKDPTLLFSMSHSPRIDEGVHWFQMLPILISTSFLIMVVRLQEYVRPLQDLYWYSGDDMNVDFFTLYKSQIFIAMGVFAVLLILYRFFCQSLTIKKSAYYIPMGIYLVFVLLSYLFSDYKEIALWGWNERFEGTIVLFAYMILLFYTMNTINTEKHVNWILWATGGVSALLGLLGLTQYFGHDFFQTKLGKALIMPAEYFDRLSFTFKNGEIYQTVYNINYVSFYLSLLVPLFGILFLNEKETKKKIAFGLLFALLIFNMIGSASSGGLMGLGVSFILALIFLRKKLLVWKKQLLIFLVVVLVVGIATFTKFAPELLNAVEGVLGKNEVAQENNGRPTIDYMDTQQNGVVMSINGETLILAVDDIQNPSTTGVSFIDGKDNPIALLRTPDDSGFILDDPRFNMCRMQPATDGEGRYFTLFYTLNQTWAFEITPQGVSLMNGVGKNVDLDIIPNFGFENNQSFGSGRGYIWSRSLPMLKDTLFIGNGADTYCVEFPQKDYVGKYNSGVYSDQVNIVIDKPHNMFLGAAINTGVISLIALLAIFILYIISCVKLYGKNEFTEFLPIVGVGIFISICGFLAAAMVNDSSISVMPMFYGILGTGIAINMMLERKKEKKETKE